MLEILRKICRYFELFKAKSCLKKLIWMYRANTWTSNVHVYVIKFTWRCDLLESRDRVKKTKWKVKSVKTAPINVSIKPHKSQTLRLDDIFHFETMYKLKLNVFRKHFSIICIYIILPPLSLLSKFYEFFTEHLFSFFYKRK